MLILAARRPAREEQEALLEIEDALEISVAERLAGGTGEGAEKALRAIRERLAL